MLMERNMKDDGQQKFTDVEQVLSGTCLSTWLVWHTYVRAVLALVSTTIHAATRQCVCVCVDAFWLGSV